MQDDKLIVLQSVWHEMTGFQFCLAMSMQDNNPKYLVGWLMPHDNSLQLNEAFSSHDEARESFQMRSERLLDLSMWGNREAMHPLDRQIFSVNVPDWQCQRVYDWERELLGDRRRETLMLRDAEILALDIQEAFTSQRSMTVKRAHYRARNSSAFGLFREIRLQNAGAGRVYIDATIHETVHVVTCYTKPAHSPAFVTALARAYEWKWGLPIDDSIDLARRMNIKTAPLSLYKFENEPKDSLGLRSTM